MEAWVRDKIKAGTVIPAYPLALDAAGKFSEKHQRALARYYAAAGAGGLAVGVHTTQFEIREPQHKLYEPVLRCAAETLTEIEKGGGPRLVRVAGIVGKTQQAIAEAQLALKYGYHAALLSLRAFGRDASDDEMVEHCAQVARVIPIFGFYLQTAVGGRKLGYDFWRRFAGIPGVVAIKMAPFNRYQTIDVIRGVADSGRASEVSLYTGNDDNIVADLLTRYDLLTSEGRKLSLRIVGGLLGHWAVWTRSAVEVQRKCRQASEGDKPIPAELLALNIEVTDMNAAVFDTANDFHGVIAGVQHVLYKQGLIPSERCLNPKEVLSPGQADELARVARHYPHLVDDDFVAANRDKWLR